MNYGSFLERLRAIVGAPHLLTGADTAVHARDWRGRYTGLPLAVVRPGSTDEVAQVVRCCAQAGVPIVPQGGNTGLVGGATPDGSATQLVLSTTRLARIRSIDSANDTLTAEAGCILQHVQQAAERAGRLFALSLAAEGSCTIGGNLATNAGGTQVLRYGNARELCLGIEAVTADGAIYSNLAGLRKDNTGYDLRDLLIGSEGTLGIITAACLKLAPLPRARLAAWVRLPSVDAAVALLERARTVLGPTLSAFELMNAFALELVARHMPQLRQPLPAGAYAVLLECSDHEDEAHAQALLEQLLQQVLEAGVADDAAVAASLQQSRVMWQIRESIPLAQAQEGLNIKHDIALPISRLAAFVHAAGAALAQRWPGMRLVNFGHLGDGNLHFNVQAPAGADAAQFLAAHEAACNELVYDLVAAHGGSFSAEHGIGQLKCAELRHYKPAVDLRLMRAVKQALDPQGLMNPGKLLG
jgi:FAD/FMN-containing dehydrogenase